MVDQSLDINASQGHTRLAVEFEPRLESKPRPGVSLSSPTVIRTLRGVRGRGVGDYTSLNRPY